MRKASERPGWDSWGPSWEVARPKVDSERPSAVVFLVRTILVLDFSEWE